MIIRYVSLNITAIITIPKHNIFTKTRTEDNFRVCDLSSCNLLAETNNFVLCAVISCLVFELQKPSSPGIEPMTLLWGCELLLFFPRGNNFDLGAVLLSCVVSELHTSSSQGIEPRTVFRGCGLLPVNSSLKQITLTVAPFSYPT
jgi:hypothetical protein